MVARVSAGYLERLGPKDIENVKPCSGREALLGGRFGSFFFCSGESEAPGGGGRDFLLKIPGRGGGLWAREIGTICPFCVFSPVL